MNTYKICFKHEGVLRFAEITSDQIANFVMSDTHEIQSFTDVIFTTEGQDFEHHFEKDGKYYIVTFSYDSVKHLNIFCRPGGKEDTDNEHIVEENVDYVPVSLTDKDDNVIWTLDNEI